MREQADARNVIATLVDRLLVPVGALIGLALGLVLLSAIDAARPEGFAEWQYGVLAASGAAIGVATTSLWRLCLTHHRVHRMLGVAQAWLRGSLSLRVGDRRVDELGQLATQLDSIAEHLEQDEQDLAQLREQSTRLSDQLRALAVDEERERLARELHDGVKQHLFSLSMTSSALLARLGAVDTIDGETYAMLREVESTSKTVQRALTRLIEDLRPMPLQERGLASALNDYTLLFGAREHILVYLDAQGSDVLLPPSVSESLYRVAQEALHNVARHARATRIDVRLRCMPEMVELQVRDNGIGFDVNQVRRGLGLGNMQDRMLSVGGRLQIDSRAGHGTRIRAEVVLAEREGGRGEVRGEMVQPCPTIEHWAWLGQRLVIPVGQIWPWLPADLAHLRRPLVSPDRGPISIDRGNPGWHLGTRYILRDQDGAPLVTIVRRRNTYQWRLPGSRWEMHYVQAPRGRLRAVLARNRQPLAAMQQQGRLLDTWCEIVYDSRGYAFACSGELHGRCTLVDSNGATVLSLSAGPRPTIDLQRTVALPLLVAATAQGIDNRTVIAGGTESLRAEV